MPPASPQRRSHDTKSRILAAARRLFAEEGYEPTTIRAVAAAAKADPALVIRYFGSKEGLFAEAATFDLRIPDLSAVPREALGAALVRHFLTRWEGDPADNALRILLRAAATNATAAARSREIFSQQVLPAVSRVAPAGEAERRAGLIASQLLGFALCRYILALPAVMEMEPETAVAVLGPTVQRYLTEPLAPDATG
ncbi:MAG TPA: TetR family transcriptional regulator [Stellaceae bacterium]|jgi:AcrR family transcriptional regulator